MRYLQGKAINSQSVESVSRVTSRAALFLMNVFHNMIAILYHHFISLHNSRLMPKRVSLDFVISKIKTG